MKHIPLLFLVLILTAVCAFGQARTAESIVDVPFSQLNTGNPRNGSVRHVINGIEGTTPCQGGGTGAVAYKINGVWECPKLTPGTGNGNVLGGASSSVGEIVLYSSTNGLNIGRSNTLSGVLRVTNGVASALPVSGAGNAVLSSGPTLDSPTLVTPFIADFTNAQHTHTNAVGGGQLNASSVFSTGTVPPARIISNTLTINRCLRLSSGGAIETAAADCGSGGGGGTPGGVSGNFQFNSSGNLGGMLNTSFNSGTGRLTVTQLADGNDTLYGLRFTDTSPTGYWLRLRNAADTTDLFSVAASGQIYNATTILSKNTSAPSTPAAGNSIVWTDSTGKNLRVQDDAGNVSGTVRAITCSGTDKISSISSAGVPTCTADQSTAGSGVITLNALTASDQTFVDVDDTNVTLSIVSSVSTHTFTIGWAGTLAKGRQNGATVYNDQANTWSTGAQDFSSTSSLKVPSATGASPSASGLIGYDLTSHTLEYGENGTNRTVVNTAGSQTLDNKTLANTTVANLRDTLLTLQDNVDSTKTVNFELGGITSGQNRVISIPDANSVTVIPQTVVASQWVRYIDSTGAQVRSQPSTSDLSGTFGPTQGGTGQSAVSQGDLLFGDNVNSWARLPKDTNSTRVLTNTGASNNPAWAQLNLANGVTGTLAGGNGGTGNAFFAVSGPATSLKTFTFPNSSATVLTDAALVTAAQGGTNNAFFQVSGPTTTTKTFTFPNASAVVLTDNAAVTIAQGGTGATTATAGFNALDPLTTKGDILTHNGTDSIRLAVGTNGFALVADSTQAAGVKWAAITASAAGSDTQLQRNNAGSLGGISGATSDGTSVTFAPATLIVGGQSATPTAVTGAFYRDTDDTKLYWAINGTTWGEVFVSGISAVNLASANVTGVLPVANGGTSFSDTTFSGNTHKLVTTTGTLTSGRCVEIDASGNFIQAAAACGSGGSGTPGGADTNVQINDAGAFFGEAAFSYNKTTNTLSVDAVTLTGTGAGFAELAEGTVPSAVANRVTIAAPTDVTAGGWVFSLPTTAGTNGQFLQTNGSGVTTWASPAGAGTVTHTGGALTANSVVLGAGTDDVKVVAGITTDGTSKLTLGVAGTSVGSIDFTNATSGTITVSPTTGALGTVTLTLPARTATIATTTGTLTTGRCVEIDASGNFIQAAAACGAGGGGTINTGTTNNISKYVGATTLDDSLLSDDGTTLAYSGTGGLSLTAAVGGFIQFTEGTPPTIVANTVQLAVVADAPAAGVQYLFGSTAAASGVLRVANSSGVMTVTQDAGISHLASSTSADLAGVLSNETGSGAAVFGTTPTITFANTGLTVQDTNASHVLTIAPGSDLTANRTLTITTGDAARTLDISGGNVTLAGAFTTSGANALTLTTTGSTNVTLPTTGTLITADGSKILTNTGLDVEGTGNNITTVEVVDFPAAGCNNATAASFWDLPTSTPAVAACVSGTNTQKAYLDFADTSGGFSAQTGFRLPGDFTGTVDAKITWLTTATAGNVKWSLSTICVATDATETDDPAFNTASTVTTAAAGVASRLQTSSITSVTITGCAAGEWMHVKIFRDGNDASDTIAATARLAGVQLVLRRAQ